MRLAVERAERDRQSGHERGLRFNAAKANRVCAFTELLPHIKGKWAKERRLIRLEPWQCFIRSEVFGWEWEATGLRRFRTVYQEVPRKNGKTTDLATLELYALGPDEEEGAEVYSVATTRDQAKLSFGPARAMALRTPRFTDRYGIEVNTHNLARIASASKLEPLSSDYNSLDGLNIHFAGVDEFHAHKTRALYDVIETATGSREQSLIWIITTAGTDRSGICYEHHTYVKKLLDGVAEDDTYFGIIYTLDLEPHTDAQGNPQPADDWRDEKAWAKANPNLGVSVFIDDMRRLARKAETMSSAQNNFLTKRLNVWVNADSAWMNMQAWEKCAQEGLSPEGFKGEPCWIGVDLASKRDIAAVMRLFRRDGHVYCFGSYFLPAETVEESDNSQYPGWVADGLIQTTPGATIDFSAIEELLIQWSREFDIQAVGYDPMHAGYLATRLFNDFKLPMVEVRPNVLNYSPAMKEWESLVLEGKFHFPAEDAVQTWSVSNVVCHTDRKDNIYPTKQSPNNKIDPSVATISGMNRMLVGSETFRSRYEEEGEEVLYVSV